MKEKSKAALFDVDGTLANVSSILHLVHKKHKKNNGAVDYREFHRQSQNCPIKMEVVDELDFLKCQGYKIVIITERSDDFLSHTESWLEDNEIDYDSLYMRRAGDKRPPLEVKKEYLEDIRKKHRPTRAYDDDPRVIEMFEEEGLKASLIPGRDPALE